MTTPEEDVVALEVGDKAPDFSLAAYPSATVSLKDFAGEKNVILAFYPKDDTPGCTKELCSFSDDLGRFSSKDTEVLGISCDTIASHEQFAQKYEINLQLLADPSGETGRKYGAVRGDRDIADRTTFVIDKKGTITYIHRGMSDNEAILSVLTELNDK